MAAIQVHLAIVFVRNCNFVASKQCCCGRRNGVASILLKSINCVEMKLTTQTWSIDYESSNFFFEYQKLNIQLIFENAPSYVIHLDGPLPLSLSLTLCTFNCVPLRFFLSCARICFIYLFNFRIYIFRKNFTLSLVFPIA